MAALVFNKISTLPAGAITVSNPDFIRYSEDGNIPCYVFSEDNPKSEIIFQYPDSTKQLDGMIKAYFGTDIESEEKILITNADSVLTPDNFLVTNGILCLNITGAGVEYYRWDWNLESYEYMNTFTFNGINYLRINFLSPEVVQFQINTTKWTLRQGRPFVYVQHTLENIGYTMKDTYLDSDGNTTSNPNSGDSISLQTAYFVRIYNSSDVYRQLIVKTEPSTIYSDSLPADNLTIIGHYDSTAIGYKTAPSIAAESFVQILHFNELWNGDTSFVNNLDQGLPSA